MRGILYLFEETNAILASTDGMLVKTEKTL